MKKKILIKDIAKKTKIPIEEVELIVNSMLDLIVESLHQRDFVSLIGFGSFVIVKKNSRELFIPGTNKKIKVQSKYGVKFRPSKKLKSILCDIKL